VATTDVSVEGGIGSAGTMYMRECGTGVGGGMGSAGTGTDASEKSLGGVVGVGVAEEGGVEG
jgi:hypothetical protein